MNVPFDLMQQVEVENKKQEIYVTEFKEKVQSKIYTNVWENLLIVVLEGKKQLQYQSFECEVREGQWGFFKRGNYIMNQILNEEKQHYKSLLLFYSNDFLKQFLARHQLVSPLKMMPQVSVQQGSVSQAMKKEINHLEGLIQDANGQMNAILKLKAEELLLYILQQDQGQFLAFIENIIRPTCDFQNYIESHYTQYQDITSLATDLNMSLSTFKRKFTEIYQIPPGKWMKEKKLEYAKALLHNTRYSITDICFMSGFNAVSTFNALFKKRYGRAPSQMKRTVCNNSPNKNKETSLG